MYCIVQKYLENLCEFMQINLDVDTTWKEILSRCRTITSYIEYDIGNYKWTYGQVVMLWSS